MADSPWYQAGPDDGRWPDAYEPREATPIGAAALEPIGIFLGSAAIQSIERQIESAPDRPVAGLLVGRPLSGEKRPFLVVTGAIPLPKPPDDEGEVRFSPGVLAQMEGASRRFGEGAVVAGWYHVRRHRGVAISGYERFTHHRYFPRPWQIALFIDTSRSASRLYRWSGNELVACDAFYYWDMTSEPLGTLLPLEPRIAAAGREAAATWQEAAPRIGARGLRWAWLLLLLLVYALIPGAPGSVPWLRHRIVQESHRLSILVASLEELTAEGTALQAQRARIGSASQAAAGSPREPAASEPGNGPVRATLTLPPLGGSSSPARSEEGSYVIQPGDTMWSISSRLLGDPWSFGRLAEQNGISDPNLIYPGQEIRLPPDR